ncbi:MAG: hypothetical protein C0623_02215 [Desulfuromonas sp.]|nr:MAG: hypothetical protein C0623_02215 [Desulfuromonas sp.]
MHLKLVWGIVLIVLGLTLSLYCLFNYLHFSGYEYLFHDLSSKADVALNLAIFAKDENQLKEFSERIMIQYIAFGVLGVIMQIVGSFWIRDYTQHAERMQRLCSDKL